MATKVKRKSYRKMKDDCRDNGTAFFEKCHHCKKKILMCGYKELRGGQCMPEKCREVRILPHEASEAIETSIEAEKDLS